MGALDLFLDLAAISSPPGEERPVADRVTEELRGLGLDVDEDGAGAVDRREHREPLLPARADRRGHAALPLRAHGHRAAGRADRAGGRGRRRPQRRRDDPRRRQQVRGRRRWSRRHAASSRGSVPHAGLELVFTPKEEVGLRGAEAFDCSRLAARVGYVYDQAGPIGEVILGAPHAVALEIIVPAASPRTQGWRRKRAAPRSPPPRARSPTCGSAGSTRRPPRTSARSTGGVARNIIPDRCDAAAPRRARTTRRSSPRSSRRCSTPAPSRPR